MLSRLPFGAIAPKKAASSAAAYNPAADAGLVVWYKADDATKGPRDALNNVPDNNEVIEQWHDSSPNADNMSRAGTDTITYLTNSLNGLPGVRVTDAAAGFISVTDAIALNSTTVSCFVLFKSEAGGEDFGRVVDMLGDGASDARVGTKSFAITDHFQSGYVWWNSDSVGAGFFGLTAGTPVSIGVIFNGPASVAKTYLSGVQQGSDRACTATLGDTKCKCFSLFGDSGASNNARGTIYEVFMTTTVVTVSEVMTYFDNKWGTH